MQDILARKADSGRMEMDELKLERPRNQRGATPGIKTHNEQGKLCDEMYMPYGWNVVFKMEPLMHRRGSETPPEKPALRGGRAGTGVPQRQEVVQ